MTKGEDAQDDFVLVRKRGEDGWLEFAYVPDRSIRLFIFEDENGAYRLNGMIVQKSVCYHEISGKNYKAIFSKASRLASKLPNLEDGKIQAMVKRFRSAGNHMPPPLQIGTGVVVAGVPIPEPILEMSTNIAGVVMVKDGIDRVKAKKTNKLKKKTTKRKSPTALSLIANCQRKWESYRVKPSKKRLQIVFDHLEKMKESKSAKVKAERSRCLRVANLEAKRIKLK